MIAYLRRGGTVGVALLQEEGMGGDKKQGNSRNTDSRTGNENAGTGGRH